MRALQPVVFAALLTAFPLSSALGQAASPASASCLSDWSCQGAGARPPLGFYLSTVTEDGRYLTLEDGSRWEVELPDRATSSAWRANDFVVVRQIFAPRNGYDWLLVKTENVEQTAAVRLVGRVEASRD